MVFKENTVLNEYSYQNCLYDCIVIFFLVFPRPWYVSSVRRVLLPAAAFFPIILKISFPLHW